MRDMKWYIFNPNNNPLCWDDQALEFDTKKDAEEFLNSAISKDFDEEFYHDAIIKECIFYYDGGYLNGTNVRVKYDAEDWN